MKLLLILFSLTLGAVGVIKTVEMMNEAAALVAEAAAAAQ